MVISLKLRTWRGDGIPAFFYRAQQTSDFIENPRVALDVRLGEALHHVRVQTVEFANGFGGLFQIQTFTQATDDADSLADRRSLAGNVVAFHGALAWAMRSRPPSISICTRRCGLASDV